MIRHDDAEDDSSDAGKEGYGSTGVYFHEDLDREGEIFLRRDCAEAGVLCWLAGWQAQPAQSVRADHEVLGGLPVCNACSQQQQTIIQEYNSQEVGLSIFVQLLA